MLKRLFLLTSLLIGKVFIWIRDNLVDSEKRLIRLLGYVLWGVVTPFGVILIIVQSILMLLMEIITGEPIVLLTDKYYDETIKIINNLRGIEEEEEDE